jgi:hypothetical protein
VKDLDDEDKQNIYAPLFRALGKGVGDEHRARLMPLIPDIADVKSEKLAFEMAKAAGRDRNRAALLIAATKATSLGKSADGYDGKEEFEEFKKDPEFKKAIGRESSDDDSSDDDSSDDDGSDDDDGDEDEEGDDD